MNAEQLIGPKLEIVNPLRWEIGHVAWFHEYFILRRKYGRETLHERSDKVYDSIAIHHETRWDLPLLEMHLNFIDNCQSLLERSQLQDRFDTFLTPLYLKDSQAEVQMQAGVSGAGGAVPEGAEGGAAVSALSSKPRL